MAISKSQKLKAIRDYYGDSKEGARCATCCNYQKSAKSSLTYVCAVFGKDQTDDCKWDGSWPTCGAYNVPFISMQPARTPLVDIIRKKKATADEEYEQPSFFQQRTTMSDLHIEGR